MSKMSRLQALPRELFDIIVKQPVTTIGLLKAVRLRSTCNVFNTSIVDAICFRQVIDVDDPALNRLLHRMHPGLKGKALAAKSWSTDTKCKSDLSVIVKVNHALDNISGETDQELVRSWHESIAGAVNVYAREDPIDAKVEAQNVLSGASIIGNLSVLRSLLEQETPWSGCMDVNGLTPYLDQPLTLAAAQGHVEVVQYLLNRGARQTPAPCQEALHLTTQADYNKQDAFKRWRASHSTPRNLTALRAAVSNGHQDIVYLLLRPEYRLPTNSLEYLRAIVAGAKARRLDLIEALCKVIGKSYRNFKGLCHEMMWAAIKSDRKEIVRMLLDEGVDVNSFQGRFLGYHGMLEVAAARGHISMVVF